MLQHETILRRIDAVGVCVPATMWDFSMDFRASEVIYSRDFTFWSSFLLRKRALTTIPRPISVEALEGRDCPATATLFNGVLTVVGTNGGNDAVRALQVGNQIAAGGQWFPVADVNLVVISAQAGDKLVRSRTVVDSIIYGGPGNDTILAGPGNDTIYAGKGDDVIYGRGANNLIYQGFGNDTITSLPGVNTNIQNEPNVTQGNSQIEMQIIQLINDFRIQNGVAPLNVNGQLNAAAALHSQDMAAISGAYGAWTGMQHELFGTLHPEVMDRLTAVGYDNWTNSYAWGENIAFGYPDAASVVNAWINSPEHRANILDPTFTDTGVSVAVDSSGRLFFTQEFGNLN